MSFVSGSEGNDRLFCLSNQMVESLVRQTVMGSMLTRLEIYVSCNKEARSDIFVDVHTFDPLWLQFSSFFSAFEHVAGSIPDGVIGIFH